MDIDLTMPTIDQNNSGLQNHGPMLTDRQ